MDGIGGIIILLFLIVSVLSKQQRVKAKDEKRREARDRAPQPTSEPSPIRPADVALPLRQAAEPTRWESEEGTSNWMSGSEMWAETQADEAMAALLHPRYEQMVRGRDITPEMAAQNAAPVVIPGLNLQFDADTLVKGVIFSEILTRRPQGGTHDRTDSRRIC